MDSDSKVMVPWPGTDFCPNCSETIAHIRHRNNVIAELKSQLTQLRAERDEAVGLLNDALPFLGDWNGYEAKRDAIEAFLARLRAASQEQPQESKS